jgi:hypothetical protein
VKTRTPDLAPAAPRLAESVIEELAAQGVTAWLDSSSLHGFPVATTHTWLPRGQGTPLRRARAFQLPPSGSGF